MHTFSQPFIHKLYMHILMLLLQLNHKAQQTREMLQVQLEVEMKSIELDLILIKQIFFLNLDQILFFFKPQEFNFSKIFYTFFSNCQLNSENSEYQLPIYKVNIIFQILTEYILKKNPNKIKTTFYNSQNLIQLLLRIFSSFRCKGNLCNFWAHYL